MVNCEWLIVPKQSFEHARAKPGIIS